MIFYCFVGFECAVRSIGVNSASWGSKILFFSLWIMKFRAIPGYFVDF